MCGGGSKILSINYIELEDVRTDESITNAYQTVRKQIPIGNQYDWLARFAVDHPGIELGIEKPYGEYSGCVDAIERFGKLKKQDISWIIDSDYSSPELCLLFGNFSFPIIRLTELEMVENIKRWHCESIMKQIWFCHRPIDGKPCGKCRPCQQKMECGMEFLLPLVARKRYRIYKLFHFVPSVFKSLKRLVQDKSKF